MAEAASGMLTPLRQIEAPAASAAASHVDNVGSSVIKYYSHQPRPSFPKAGRLPDRVSRMKDKPGARGQGPPQQEVPGNPFQAFLSLFWNTPWRVPVVILLTVGSLLALAFPHVFINRLKEVAKILRHSPPAVVPLPFPTDPKVVAIAPDSEFGTLHFTGLELGLLNGNDLSMVRFSAPIADMKRGAIEPIKQQLSQTLAQHDVVAVVGPGITECTRDILQTVERSGEPVVVFANSAAPRYLLQTEKGATPVFRINSGIDERAGRIAQLTQRLLEQRVHVLYLVEQNPDSGRKSFGQELACTFLRNCSRSPTWNWEAI